MQTGRYAAIVLAAGFSSRMEKFKPLLPLAEHTITDQVVSTFSRCGIDVILVTGWQQKELRASIRSDDITIVENPDFQEGMFTSVQAGIRHLQPWHESFFIMPVDIPLVREATIKRMLNEAGKHPDSIIYPTFGDRRGHPPLIPSALIPHILDWKEGGGLKAALTAKKDRALHISVPDSNILFDIDTAKDYDELLERFRHYDIPTGEECEVILTEILKTTVNTRRQCHEAADIAVRIGESIKSSGNHVDLKLLHAAATLQGVVDDSDTNIDSIAGRLHELGFGRVGDIVSSLPHPATGTGIPLAAKIVFVSNTFVRGKELATGHKQPKHTNWSGQSHSIHDREQYKKFALDIKQELEALAGQPLDHILFCSYLI